MPRLAAAGLDKDLPILYYAKYLLILNQFFREALVNVSLMRYPSAFLPILMSFAALALVLGSVAIFGVVHETDEGAAAHLFQLLMAAQVPFVAYFAIRWLPRVPGQALVILALQAGAALAAFAPVYWFQL